MIIVEANNNIHKRWRDANGERQQEVSLTYRPYFFIERGQEMPEVIERRTKFGTNRIRPMYTFGEWVNIHNEPLVKVTCETMGDLYQARDNWDETFEADISMSRKYTNDNMEEIIEYDLRKWYLDIETQVGGRYNKAINALTFTIHMIKNIM